MKSDFSNISPEKACEILKAHGIEMSPEKAKKVLEMIDFLCKLVVNQQLKK